MELDIGESRTVVVKVTGPYKSSAFGNIDDRIDCFGRLILFVPLNAPCVGFKKIGRFSDLQ